MVITLTIQSWGYCQAITPRRGRELLAQGNALGVGMGIGIRPVRAKALYVA